MNRILAIVFAVCLAFAAALGWMGHALTHHCPKCASVSLADSTVARKPDTVRYDSLVPVRVPVPVPYAVHDTIHDTIPVAARTVDSCDSVGRDTTTANGIRSIWSFKARLIVPPVTYRNIIIPAPDTIKTRVVTVVEVQYKTDWKLVTIAGLAGMLGEAALEKYALKH